MTMTLDRPERRAPSSGRSGSNTASAAQRLRANFAAVRVAFQWWGIRKTLNAEQKAQAAESFGAEGQYLSAAKKLLETKGDAWGRVSSVRSQILACWRSLSLPFPESGVRLIKQTDVERFNGQMTEFRQELNDAVANLDSQFEVLKSAARSRLGRLYNEAAYPRTLRGLFFVEWDYPNVEPPEYLLRLHPSLYEQASIVLASWQKKGSSRSSVA